MSIKEAIERGPLSRPRTRIPLSPPDRLDRYTSIIEAKGRVLLKSSGVTKVLADLKKIINLDFPDVESRLTVDADRAVVTQELRWDFVKHEEGFVDFKVIRIHAWALTKEIVVERTGELLSGKQLKDRVVVEDAIAEAYRDPLFQSTRFRIE